MTGRIIKNLKKKKCNNVKWANSNPKCKYYLRVIACNSGTQMRVRDSSATRIFFKKIKMMQPQAQKITPKF